MVIVFFSLSRNILDSVLNYATKASFHTLSSSLFTNHSTNRHIALNTDNVVRQTINETQLMNSRNLVSGRSTDLWNGVHRKHTCWIVIQMFFFNNLDWGPVPRFAPWKHCSQCGDSPFSKRSYFGRQVSLASTTRGRVGGTMGEKWWPNGAWDINPGFFYIPQMGPIILLPFRRTACWGFYRPF